MDLAPLDGQHALWLLAANTLLQELGVPVPVIPTALLIAARVVRNPVDLVLLTGVIVVASLVGNIIWFAVGRRYGASVLPVLSRRSRATNAWLSRIEQAFQSRSSLLLVMGRFVPGAALVTSPLAGALGMSVGKFIALTAAGAALYAVVVLGLGVLMRNGIEALLLAASDLRWPIVFSLAVIAAAYAASRWCRTYVLGILLARRHQAASRTNPSIETVVQ